jgi:hypothetical protein
VRFLRVPIDLRRATGYPWADLSLTWRNRTRMFRVRWLRER